jgi:hypothetical protein
LSEAFIANLFVMVPPKEIEAIEQRARENMFDVAPPTQESAWYVSTNILMELYVLFFQNIRSCILIW